MSEVRKPDALMVPGAGILSADDTEQAAREVYERAKSILGVSRAFVRNQGELRFITGSPYCTINHPSNSPLSGLPRYTWETQADGWQYGYLTEEAKANAKDH